MVDLIKAFGRGILYIICFPFFIVALAIFAIVGLLAFIFQIIKSIIFFFTGQRFFPELPEDKELRLMREAEEAKNNPTPAMESGTPSTGAPLMFQEVFGEEDFEEEPTPVMVSPAPAPTPAPAPIVEEEEEEIEEKVEEEALEEETPAPEFVPLMREEDDEPEEPEEDEEDLLEDILNASSNDEEEEILETYHPQGTNDDSYEDDDEDEEDPTGGVKIHFDD